MLFLRWLFGMSIPSWVFLNYRWVLLFDNLCLLFWLLINIVQVLSIMTFGVIAWITASMILENVVNQWLIYLLIIFHWRFIESICILLMSSIMTGSCISTIRFNSLFKILNLTFISFLSKIEYYSSICKTYIIFSNL